MATFPNKILTNVFNTFIELCNPINQTAKLRLFCVTFVSLQNMGGYFASFYKEQMKTVHSVPIDAVLRETLGKIRRQTAWPADPSTQPKLQAAWQSQVRGTEVFLISKPEDSEEL